MLTLTFLGILFLLISNLILCEFYKILIDIRYNEFSHFMLYICLNITPIWSKIFCSPHIFVCCLALSTFKETMYHVAVVNVLLLNKNRIIKYLCVYMCVGRSLLLSMLFWNLVIIASLIPCIIIAICFCIHLGARLYCFKF